MTNKNKNITTLQIKRSHNARRYRHGIQIMTKKNNRKQDISKLRELFRSFYLRFPELDRVVGIQETSPVGERFRTYGRAIVGGPDALCWDPFTGNMLDCSAASSSYLRKISVRGWDKSFLPARLSEAIYGGGMFTGNHQHWLWDVCLRLAYAREMDDTVEFPKDLPILVRGDVSDRQKEILRFFGFNNPILPVKKPVLVDGLYVSRLDYGTIYDGEFMRKMRNVTDIHTLTDYPKKLYIQRSGRRRRMIDEDQIADLLCGLGFAQVIFDDMDYRKQAEYVYNADVILSMHGSALSNLWAAKPGTSVVEIRPPFDVSDVVSRVSYSSGLHYQVLSAKPVLGGMHVDQKWLKATLELERTEGASA